MATAERNSEERIVKIIQETEVTEFVDLRLTLDEAQVLQDLTQITSGCPRSSRRGLIDAISNALNKADIWPQYTRGPTGRVTRHRAPDLPPSCTIYFENSDGITG